MYIVQIHDRAFAHFTDHTVQMYYGAISKLSMVCASVWSIYLFANWHTGERSGSVVECLTRDRGAADSSLTGVTALRS